MQTAISPVQVYPATANTLYIRSIGLGPPPSYYYELQDVQVVAGTPAVGVEGEEGYVPATPDTTTVVVLKNGNVSMTQEQWDAWPAGPETGDDDYQLNAITANLGLTRA
jgi:hypothetical protein